MSLPNMSVCIRSSISGPSVSIVLTTVELLETIFLCLDMRCLLTLAPRVCRRWRDVIQGSVLLQRALFFKGEEEPAASHTVTFNPLLVELFPPLFNFHSTPELRGFNDLAIEALPTGRRRVAFYRRNASWRRMHMRQPPVKHVGLWTLDKIRHRKEKMQLIRYDRGLRMEGFYHLVLKHVFWWDLFVKWGETQGRQLRHLQFARVHMKASAEEMIRTADVTIGGLGDDYCVDEESVRRPLDSSGLVKMKMGHAAADNDRVDEEKVRKDVVSNGLVKMGIFWFKVKEPDDGQVLWTRRDGPGPCPCGRYCTQ